ncbi:MAG TPA: lipopolysaccharide transport periplasmic protein LptA [Methylomirabilota bacterium]|jgi:lipopolysaccharide export system protein LptA|nr:lipopolysaccharide transport periplasmic protein LptA [Methylomirabilota bacterium]
MSLLAVAALTVLPAGVLAQTPAKRGGAAAPKAGGEERPRAVRDKDDQSQPVTVDADKMERFGKEGLVVFTGNVIARQNNSVQYADRMEVYLDESGDKILRTISTGAVRIITRDCRTGTARRAEYYDLEQRVVLLGNARVWQEDNIVSGETITIFLSQDRSVVEGGQQERVKAVFYPRDKQAGGADQRPSKAAAVACMN